MSLLSTRRARRDFQSSNSLAVSLILCGLILTAVGCSGTGLVGDSEDPIYVAKKVHKNKVAADKLLRKVQEKDIEILADNLEAVDLLKRVPDPSDDDIASLTNLCRCGTYPRIRSAIKRAAATINAGGKG